MNDICWIPEIIEYKSDKYGTWSDYYDLLYEIFKKDFILSKPNFENKPVNIRKFPMEFGKEEAFFHITCQDYLHNRDRSPDLRRCERIRWVRAFIEKYNCDSSLCDDCDGVKVWPEKNGSKEKINIFLEEERYLVVLEKRPNYYLLITAFYIDRDHTLEKKVKQYYRHIDNLK